MDVFSHFPSLTDIASSDISYKAEDEKVIFKFGEELPVGAGCLCLEFTGELNDKMKGFYRSNYTTPSGESRVCAVTQFEVSVNKPKPCKLFNTLHSVNKFLKSFQI